MNYTFGLKAKIDQEVKQLGGINKMLTLPNSTDKELTLLFGTIFDSFDVMFLATNSNPLAIITIALVCLYGYLKEGLMDNSPQGLCYVGWVYAFFFKDPDCYNLTRIGEELFSKDLNPTYNVVATRLVLGIGSLYGGNLQHYLSHLNAGWKYSVSHSEFLFGSYCNMNELNARFLNGENFFSIIQKAEQGKQYFHNANHYLARDTMEMFINIGKDMTCISNFNPQYQLPNFKEVNTINTLTRYMEGALNFMKGSYEKALELFTEVFPMMSNQLGLIGYHETMFFYSLTVLHFYKQNKTDEALELINKLFDDYESFSKISPDFFEIKFQLLKTYRSFVEKKEDNTKILAKYEDIIVLANKFGLIIVTALAYEYMLELCHDGKFPKSICVMYYDECFKIWNDLSAKAK
eukprot:gene13121-8729_t